MYFTEAAMLEQVHGQVKSPWELGDGWWRGLLHIRRLSLGHRDDATSGKMLDEALAWSEEGRDAQTVAHSAGRRAPHSCGGVAGGAGGVVAAGERDHVGDPAQHDAECV